MEDKVLNYLVKVAKRKPVSKMSEVEYRKALHRGSLGLTGLGAGASAGSLALMARQGIKHPLPKIVGGAGLATSLGAMGLHHYLYKKRKGAYSPKSYKVQMAYQKYLKDKKAGKPNAKVKYKAKVKQLTFK